MTLFNAFGQPQFRLVSCFLFQPLNNVMYWWRDGFINSFTLLQMKRLTLVDFAVMAQLLRGEELL